MAKVLEMPGGSAFRKAVDNVKAGEDDKKPRPHWTTFVRGKRRQPGTMNATERAYAEHLEQRQRLSEIVWFEFEAITFKIGPKVRYTPDFLVMLPNGLMECHECKGFWADDAKVKIKVAAGKFPFRFVAVTKEAKKRGGGWKMIDFSEDERSNP